MVAQQTLFVACRAVNPYEASVNFVLGNHHSNNRNNSVNSNNNHNSNKSHNSTTSNTSDKTDTSRRSDSSTNTKCDYYMGDLMFRTPLRLVCRMSHNCCMRGIEILVSSRLASNPTP